MALTWTDEDICAKCEGRIEPKDQRRYRAGTLRLNHVPYLCLRCFLKLAGGTTDEDMDGRVV